MASTYLQKTFAGAPTSAKIFTISCWIKKSSNGSDNSIYGKDGSATSASQFYFNTSDQLRFFDNTSGTAMDLLTNRVFRDNSAWFHIVWSVDSTQGTASNRVKLYVNGVQETSFATSNYPDNNASFVATDNGKDTFVGVTENTSGTKFGYLNGLLAHYHFTDGTAYDANTFGETDATTGIWKPKVSPSVTYGTNGFFLKFNEGALGTDSSPNGNNFTVNGSLTPAKDTPQNVFATLNPLVLLNDNLVLSGGNLTASKASGVSTGGYFSTLGASSGKYYWEAKCIATGASDGWIGIGQDRTFRTNNGDYPGANTYTVAIGHTGTLRYNGSTVGSYTASSWTAGDIISVALDLDNNYVYFAKNGTWMNSGNPESGATGTGGYTNATIFDGSLILSVNSLYQSGGDYDWNFGNGYFGLTPVASAQNPDDGIGIFEYTVPTGYKALCTKSINAQEYS